MFKYVGYDLKNDTLIATNSKSDWALTLGHIPQQCEYFYSIKDACSWLKDHPDAHQKYLEELEELEKEYQSFCDYENYELNN